MTQQGFQENGFAVFPKTLADGEVDTICAIMDELEKTEPDHARGGKVFAARDVFARNEDLLRMASEGPLLSLACTLGGKAARPTKATFFDKRPEANWTLPLHQDLTITLQHQADVPGYTHWSTKAGVPHVQPPVRILESIVALRVHLDDCPIENGALEVVPGSHRIGRVSPATLRQMHLDGEAAACPAKAGDVLAMRPLLVHGSRKASVPRRRRVLHIEYCGVVLDAPLAWPDWKEGHRAHDHDP
jgi:hypothetical protein